MKLFEAIVDANHRAIAGDPNAGLRPADYRDALPVVALTCIDPRLNSLLPNVLGIEPEDFVWTRNAGNIITGPLSSTMRSLALACAIRDSKEIAIIGHSDCKVRQTTAMELIDRFKALGVDRAKLPDNLNEYFGLFASERQNVIKAVDFVRRSPLIGPKTPVHGLLVDIQTGKLEWLVNGYQTMASVITEATGEARAGGARLETLDQPANLNFTTLSFPSTKIGDLAFTGGQFRQPAPAGATTKAASPAPAVPTAKPAAPAQPPVMPLPPSIKPKPVLHKAPRY